MALQEPTIIYYLYMMHPLFLDAILAGKVTERKHDNVRTRDTFEQYHALNNFPGIYLNVLCRTANPTAANAALNASQWAGHNLKPSELMKVCESMRFYLRIGDDKADKYAARVDAVYGQMHDKDRPKSSHIPDGIDYKAGERRYGRSEEARRIVRSWADAIEARITPLKSSYTLWRTPLSKCFHEVGWGRNYQSRASKHTIHDGTNSLFGLMTAIVQHEFPGYFMINQFQMARLIRPEDARLMEVYCSILAGAYWFWGGLNPVLAGNVPMQGKTSAMDPRVERNCKTSATSRLVEIRLKENLKKEDRIEDWTKDGETIVKGDRLEKRIKAIEGCLEEFSLRTDMRSTLVEVETAWANLRESLLAVGLDLTRSKN